MKYTVGLQFTNEELLDCIIENKEHIREVYFSWGDFPNGRSSQLQSERFSCWELQEIQNRVLQRLSEQGISLNLLFNGNCYGKDSQSRAFFYRVGETVDYIGSRFGLATITTTSPLIAKFLKSNFPEVRVVASVNMEIGTVQGMDYLAEYFDGYYMKREWNRDFEKIRQLSSWCKANGKNLHILANSGCLNHCSAHHFHDNLVAHELEISQMDNAYQFTGICREYLRDSAHYRSLIEDTNFIRPEDVALYEPYFESMKLATRIHRVPSMILNSYIRGKYSGNILELLEPAHNIYPYVLENGEPMRLVCIDEASNTERREKVRC